MRFTQNVTAAYIDGMDIAVLLLLLWMTGGNEEMKSSLRSFLSFYRENRDLVSLFANSSAEKKGDERDERDEKDVPCSSEQQKSRPRGEVGAVDILQRYLMRATK